MIRLLNAALVLAVLGAGFTLYSLEHAARRTERTIAALEARIADEKETIKLLNAEWSYLTRPERIQKLAADLLGMGPASLLQTISPREIATRIPAEPPVKLEAEGKDPIGKILKSMAGD